MGTVWILGAGFSKPLGGPLLTDIFSVGHYDTVCGWLAENDVRSAEVHFALVRELYLQGERRHSWANPEEFLACASDASSRMVDEERVRRVLGTLEPISAVGQSIKPEEQPRANVAAWVSQYIAAAVSCFVEPLASDGDDIPELWMPHAQWYGRLTAMDTIITFNYDRVLEELNAHCRPSDFQAPKILYTHGRVPPPDQLRGAFGSSRLIDELAVPGRAKKPYIVNKGRETWEAGATAIREADRICCIGYSLPRTDIYTRYWLQRQLANCSPNVNTLLVMGRENPDVENLRRVFASLDNAATPTDAERYTEEFLSDITAAPSGLTFGGWL